MSVHRCVLTHKNEQSRHSTKTTAPKTTTAKVIISYPAPLLSRKQVAEILGVHVKTIERYDRAGMIHALRINRRVVRYRRDEVERMLSLAA